VYNGYNIELEIARFQVQALTITSPADKWYGHGETSLSWDV